MGRIVTVVVIVLILIAGYFGWLRYHANKVLDSGEVHWVAGKPSDAEMARFNREDHGETADGQSEHKNETARQSATEIAAGGTGYNGATQTSAGTTQAVAQPVAQPTGQTSSQPTYQTASQPTYQTTGMAMNSTANAPAGMPMQDSQAANAPNGMRFGSSGNFQWYRQGNLTWRQDTANGQSCIVYATMEEWRKEIVMSHACGRGA